MEYVLLLAIVLALFLVVRATFGPIIKDAVSKIIDKIEKKYFAPGNFHRFPR